VVSTVRRPGTSCKSRKSRGVDAIRLSGGLARRRYIITLLGYGEETTVTTYYSTQCDVVACACPRLSASDLTFLGLTF
jgi:hypothetical protein